jgi:glutamate-1-semialdehyde 2,1-aminomutase
MNRGGQPPNPKLSRLLAELTGEYRSRTPQSAARHAEACRVLPGGETRSVTHYPPYPVRITDGKGAELVDADGRSYLDLVNNYTSLVHGNAFPPAAQALARLAGHGLAFASTHARQVALAEHLTHRLASVELVRFTNSGSEAGVLAARLAQHATGRPGLVVFAGGYHGSAPPLLPADPSCVVVPYNDAAALRAAVTDEVAAVFAEPFLGAGGVIPAAGGFLRAVQDIAHDRGALFVMDEVQSLRNHLGGAQGAQQLSPDLTMLGKIIGGGFPIGAVGGRRDLLLMTAARSRDSLAHSGTFNGHIAAATAGLVTLQHLDATALDQLEAHGSVLEGGISAAARAHGVPLTVTRAGSILNVHSGRLTGRGAPRPAAGDGQQVLAILHLALLLDGVYTTPRGMVNASTALSAAAVDAALAAYDTALARIGGCLDDEPAAEPGQAG